MAKVTIRIPGAIDPKGRWIANGWGDERGANGPDDHAHLLEIYDYDTIGPNEFFFWLTAEIEIPDVPTVVAAAAPAPEQGGG